MSTGKTIAIVATLLIAIGPAAGLAAADELSDPHPKNHCSRTAMNVLRGCNSGAIDDYWIKRGQCENLRSAEARGECLREASQELLAAMKECRDQHDVRLEVCNLIGEEPYDPQIDPDQFVQVIDNPYLPLTPGTTMIYEGTTENGFEHIEVRTTSETIDILGVTCVVVVATEWIDGNLVEITDDYFAQDLQGNVWYFGERALDFENGHVVSLDGSWAAGVEGAKPGIVMHAYPPPMGQLYRQEFSLSLAEDMGEVISDTETVTVAAGSFSNCLQTLDTSPLEPDAMEEKYYAETLGKIMEINVETGDRLELVNVIIE